jgi:LPS-assembly lipoprotein
MSAPSPLWGEGGAATAAPGEGNRPLRTPHPAALTRGHPLPVPGRGYSRRALLVLPLALAACGFQPLYGERTRGGPGSVEALGQIAVGAIPDRLGQILRNNLVDRLTPAGEPDRPRYRLAVALIVSKEGLAITKDESITRFNLRINASFVLYDAQSNAEVTRGVSRTIAAYNVVTSQFATLVAEKDAESRAARELSDDIRTRLAVFFTRAPGSATGA